MPIGQTLPFTAVRWDDVLFVALAVMLLGSALLVVTMRDIIRCGLAMIASFA
jgi:NADH:ubiquinone oxidoreductase subunit 6 (subunit J)